MYRMSIFFVDGSHTSYVFKEDRKEEFDNILQEFFNEEKRIYIIEDNVTQIINTDNVMEICIAEE